MSHVSCVRIRQNFNVVIFSDTMNMINAHFSVMVVLIKLYPFIPLSVGSQNSVLVERQRGRTSPSRWRGCSHRSHDNLQQNLADRRMANPVDPVLSHQISQKRQPAAVPDLPNDQPHQSQKQIHAEDHAETIEATSEDHR